MYEKIKPASSENDTVTPGSALKRKYQPEMYEEDNWNGRTTSKFNDMCDDVIDMILCDLQLEDLANISDTSTRLRGIAGSVFSRKHSHSLISMDTFHYSRNLRDYMREALPKDIPVRCKHDAIVRICDAKIWFKLMRNFGASIKYVRIHSYSHENETSILSALQNLIKYVTNFCGDSLETLDVDGYRFLTLNKSLINLQEFCLYNEFSKNGEALELMPNLRTLKLGRVPKTLAKNYAKLERIHLQLESDEDVQTFISFLRLNRQIKYLSICICYKCAPEHNDLIHSSIADNLTQLTTLKLYELNKPEIISHYSFKTVESFSIGDVNPQIIFEFNDLKKVTLQGTNSTPSYCINFARRNKKLQILKLCDLHETWLNASDIQNLLNELPELEQIIVHSYSRNVNRYSIWKNLLGSQWEQFEKEKSGRFKPRWAYNFQRFRKIESTRQLKLN